MSRWGIFSPGALGNVEYPFIGITSRSTLTGSGTKYRKTHQMLISVIKREVVFSELFIVK